MTLTLYKLEDELLAWANSFEMAESDEQRMEIAERVSAYLQQAREKRDRFVEFLRHIDSQIKLAGEEESRIAQRRIALQNMRASLEEYAIRTMEALDLRKLEGNTSTLSLARRPVSVILTDESKVPLCFKRATITLPAEQAMDVFEQFDVDPADVKYATSRTEIKKAIESGQDVPGADLRMGLNSLRIK